MYFKKIEIMLRLFNVELKIYIINNNIITVGL